MSDRKPKTAKASHRPGRKVAMFHGVRLAKLSVPTQFTQEQIEEAVKWAVAKNADALAGRK